MKKYILALFLVGFLLASAFSLVQAGDVNQNPTAPECISIENNLRYKDKDVSKNNEVTILQAFLKAQGYLNNAPTGYFGLLTKKAVKDFQRENGVSPTGSVLSITKLKLKTLTCTPENSPVCDYPAPSRDCSYIQGSNYNLTTQCGMILNCANANTPVISGVSGPQTLNINQQSTWVIRASDPNQSSLSYSVNWGETCLPGTDCLESHASPFQQFQQIAIFAHSYTRSGVYTPTFTVTNSSGQSAQTSLSVSVGETFSNSRIVIFSPNIGDVWTSGNNYEIRWSPNPSMSPVASKVTITLNAPRPACLDATPACKIAIRQIAPFLIAENVPDTGSYNFTVPKNLPETYSENMQVTVTRDRPESYGRSAVFNVNLLNFINMPVISGVSGPQTLDINQVGTWKVTASSSNGGELAYSVDWGDRTVICPSGIDCPTTSPQQTATFTHRYFQAGVYTATFTVTSASTIYCITTPCPGNGGSAQTSLSVNVGGVVSIPSITVLSPNGGETWKKGTTQIIKWQDNTVSTCPSGSICDPAPNQFDIKLTNYYPPCTGNTCPLYPYASPYIIASNVSGYGSSRSYSWNVGQVKNNDRIVSDGTYTIQICASGSDVCDSSDSYFKIISSATVNPVISGVSGPQTLNVGQQGTWTVTARDPSGGNLTYSVNWGDETVICPSGINCPQTTLLSQQTATFTHTYNTAGIYNPTFTVTNTNGQSAQTSLSVNVGGVISTNRPPVLNLISVPVNIQAGQLVNFTFSATDPDNDNLVWSISWGDGTGEASLCPIPNPQQGQGWAKSVSHTWANTGTYNVQYTVSDCRGGTASNNFNVNVGELIPTPSITVTSPRAGEAWRVEGAYSIRWISNDPTLRPVASRVSITLNSPYPTCLDAVPACAVPLRSPYVIAENLTDTGSYIWAIPTSLPDAYRGKTQITVVRTTEPRFAGRSGTFTIAGSPTARVSISSLQPTAGPVGATVTVTGSGFTPTGNRIKFSDLGSENNPRYNLNSSDGRTIVFPVPSGNYYACWYTTPACEAPAFPPRIGGTYGVSVLNANGVSNEVQFTVTSDEPSASTSLPLSANVLDALNSANSSVQNTSLSCPSELNITLKMGMNNSQVKCLQKILNAKGFKVEGVKADSETTYFGKATFRALKAFQASANLTVDGIFGPASHVALKSVTQ